MTAYLDAMQRYFDFSGRSTRSQFWLFHLIYAIILIVSAIIDVVILNPNGEALVASGLVSLVHFIPSLSVLVRRLHDIGRSGAWLLIAFVPVIGFIVLLIFACTPTQADAPQPAARNPHGRRDPDMAAPAQPLMAATAPSNALDQLEKLQALRASGVLSDEEFASMKAQLLQQNTR